MPIGNKDQLNFAVFCIEGIAEALHVDAPSVYDALAVRSRLLNDYVMRFYDALHTQDRQYVVDDILREMQAEGVTL